MIQISQNRPIGVTVSEWCQSILLQHRIIIIVMAKLGRLVWDSLSNEVVEQAIVPIPMNVISSSHSSQKRCYSRT
ncbi:MAG: hypothetical protein ACLU8S_00100 [Coprococcus phoceensis]